MLAALSLADCAFGRTKERMLLPSPRGRRSPEQRRVADR